MSRFVSKWLIILMLALPAVAAAQDDQPVMSRGQGWSVHSGQTVGDRSNVVFGEVGWPGLSVSLLHGATSRFDIGGRLTLINYGFEGRINDVLPGMKLQMLTRIGLVETSRFNLGLAFGPGVLFYFPRFGPTIVGIALPLEINAGIPIGSAIMINFGMDMPMFVTFGRTGSFFIPILFGGGVEYFLNRNLAFTFNLKMGPSIHTASGHAEFAMEALLGIAYRF